MAPEVRIGIKDKHLEGFLNEDNSIPIENLPIMKESDAKIIYDIEPKPFARGKFAQVKYCRRKQLSPSNGHFGEGNTVLNNPICSPVTTTTNTSDHVCGSNFAAKFIKKRRRCADVTHEILHEIRVLFLSRNHERIIQLFHVYESAHEYILILEMASGGDLQRVLDGEDSLPELTSIKFMRQILEGVSYLHSINIAHLDIKPQNILLDSPYPNTEKVKLCDFGISRLITDGVELREIVGTPDYVAPEVLHYEPISLSTDLWSIGCLSYVLLTGYSPFGADNKQETFCNITNGILEFPNHLFGHISASAVHFIKRLLVKDPKNRMNCEECLQHEWTTDQLIVLKKQEALNSPSASPINGVSANGAISVSDCQSLLDKINSGSSPNHGQIIDKSSDNNNGAIDERLNNQINLSK